MNIINLTGNSCKTTHENNNGPISAVKSGRFRVKPLGISLTKSNIIFVSFPFTNRR